MIGKIIFNVVAFTLFVLMFINFVRKNDTNYTYIITIQAIGIFVNFLELMFGIKLYIPIKILVYFFSIIIPIIILVIDYKNNISITELIGITRAEICFIIKKNNKAEKYLLGILKKYPTNKFVYQKLGILYEKENRIEEAIREYEVLINLNYTEKIYARIGKLYRKIGKIENSKTIFEDIVKENPNNYEANMNLADILYEIGEYKNSIQIYNNLLKSYPNDYNIYYSLGMTYTMLNDFQKANENYSFAAKINSNLHYCKYCIAHLCLIYEDFDKAKLYFEECSNFDETDAKAYYYLARIALVRGEVDIAIGYAKMSIEIDSEMYFIMQKDNIFVTIMNSLDKPSRSTEKKELNYNEKEKSVVEYLEKITKIVGKLKNDDIQMIENVMKTKKEEEKKIEIENDEKRK